MWNRLKMDFRSVKGAIDFTFNRTVPVWAIVLWYTLMLPIGLLLYPFAKLYLKILLWRLDRDLED